MSEAKMTDSYRHRLANHMTDGTSLKKAKYMAFGDGGHNVDLSAKIVDSSAISLSHELLRKEISYFEKLDLFTPVFYSQLNAEELPEQIISEIGLFDEDGNMIALKNQDAVTKSSSHPYSLSMSLRF